MVPSSATLSDSQLDTMWRVVTTGGRLGPDCGVELPLAASVTEVMSVAHRTNDVARAMAKAKGLNKENAQKLSSFLEAQLASGVSSQKEDDPSWKVSVIVNNGHVKRSLHLVAEMEIVGEGPQRKEKVEMSVREFGRLRYELARALKAAESYS